MLSMIVISLVICGILFHVDVLVLIDGGSDERLFCASHMIGLALAIITLSLVLANGYSAEG